MYNWEVQVLFKETLYIPSFPFQITLINQVTYKNNLILLCKFLVGS